MQTLVPGTLGQGLRASHPMRKRQGTARTPRRWRELPGAFRSYRLDFEGVRLDRRRKPWKNTGMPFDNPFTRRRPAVLWGNSEAGPSRRLPRTQGVMIVEAAVVVACLSMMAVAIYSSMTRINDFATTNRLSSLATSIVTDQAERALGATGFLYVGPGSSSNTTPTELTTGTTTATVGIYVDPDISVSGTNVAQLQVSNTAAASFALITGTMTTVVTDRTDLLVSSTGAATLPLIKQTNVSLSYKYRGRSYQVSTSTLRAPVIR